MERILLGIFIPKKMRYSLIVFAVAITFLNCTDNRKKIVSSDINNLTLIDSSTIFNPIDLLGDSLTINARFSECGEWGGHKEKIIISVDRETRNVFADYEVYPFNCDSMPYYEGRQILKPIVNKRITLDNNKKKSIVDYILRLSQSKITESFPGHAGNIFSVIKSDSTLIIQVYDNKEYDVNSYKRLIADLF